MTHLRIELNNIQENVSSAVIKKLYELATSGDLDLNSNLAGNLHVLGTYLEYIDGITGEFPELTISSDNIYIMFADPEVERVMATLFGNGTNVSVSNLTGVTALPANLFKDNTNVHTFNELNNLRGITTLGREAFSGCTNLTSINTGNITELGYGVFIDCASLTNIDVSNIESYGKWALSWTGITKLIFPKLITIDAEVFKNSQFTYLEFGPNLTSIGTSAFWDCGNLTTLVFRSTTPPTFSDTQRGDKFLYNMGACTIYVPDASISDYLTAWPNMATLITGISNLPQS